MKRRTFLAGLGGVATMPFMARAQQSALPVVGFLDPRSPNAIAAMVQAFRQGLSEAGFVEGRSVVIDYRWAQGQFDKLPALAAELVQRKVAVLAAVGGPASAFAAKAATTTVPVVFIVGDDPVKIGLVPSLSRPGGNLTGINLQVTELAAKRLELLRELVPSARRVALLVNPANASIAEATAHDVKQAAGSLGLQVQVHSAGSSDDIDKTFASFANTRPDVLFVTADPLYTGQRAQLTRLASQHAIPAIYAVRQLPEAGGLISYGPSLTDAYRQAGAYAGRILKGTKPADLPVTQPTTFDLTINLKTAKALGLNVPQALLTSATEVIE